MWLLAERATLKGHTGRVERWQWRPTAAGWLLVAGRYRTDLGYPDWAGARPPAGHTQAREYGGGGARRHWPASGSDDQTVRMWDGSEEPYALMRMDSEVHDCAWLGTDGLVMGGSAGLYLFDFVADAISTTAAKHRITG